MAEACPVSQQAPRLFAGLVEGPSQRLDKPDRSGSGGGVTPRQVGQLVRQDRAELALVQNPQERQAQDQGAVRPAPGDDPATGQVGQADLAGGPNPQTAGHVLDRREQGRGVNPRQDRPEVAVGIANLGDDVNSAQRPEHVAPVVDLVAEPAPDHRPGAPAGEPEGRTGEHPTPVGPLDRPQAPAPPPQRDRSSTGPGSGPGTGSSRSMGRCRGFRVPSTGAEGRAAFRAHHASRIAVERVVIVVRWPQRRSAPRTAHSFPSTHRPGSRHTLLPACAPFGSALARAIPTQ